MRVKHLEGIYYADGQACYLSGSKIKDKDGKPELQILVSYCNAKEAIEMYRKIWQVETLFKGLKYRGVISKVHMSWTVGVCRICSPSS